MDTASTDDDDDDYDNKKWADKVNCQTGRQRKSLQDMKTLCILPNALLHPIMSLFLGHPDSPSFILAFLPLTTSTYWLPPAEGFSFLARRPDILSMHLNIVT